MGSGIIVESGVTGMRRHYTQSDSLRSPGRNSGFTMIEILITIGIMGLLVTILIFALGPSLESARINATRTTLEQLDAAIQARLDAIQRLDVSVEAKKLAALNSGMSQEEAEFFIRKNLVKQALPQRPEDLRGMDGTDGNADDSPINAAYQGSGGHSSASANQPERCSEVLLFALTQGGTVRVMPSGKSYSIPTLDIGELNTSHLVDSDSNGLQEVIDEWDNPIRFYRWPTRLIRTGGAGATISASDVTYARTLIASLGKNTSNNGPLATDPDDPTGLLYNDFTSMSLSIRYGTGMSDTVSADSFGEAAYHTPATFHAPLLMSLGPDETSGMAGEPTSGTAADRLGLLEDTDTMTAGIQPADSLFDNITNRQQ
ncbi:MAG: type II secretion system protein [Planctomycetaceae bacterium]|nr:type II secretion system protein [Planctomycetaceae bacterium]